MTLMKITLIVLIPQKGIGNDDIDAEECNDINRTELQLMQIAKVSGYIKSTNMLCN